MRNIPAKLTAALALTLALSACELRQDGAEEPAPEASATEEPLIAPSNTPSPDASESPVASIIREDARSEELEIPVEALHAIVPFGEGGNDLSEQAERMLIGVLQSEAMREGWPVTLRGHTDSSGNDSANLRASRARAEAVAAWLVERGVADDRIAVIAFGEQNPIAPNAKPDGTANDAGRARNRRVDIEIAPEQQPGTGAEANSESDDA